MRVLLVEDTSSVARVVVEALTEHGIDVTHAASFAEGTARVAEGGWDVIVSDFDLGDGIGSVLLDMADSGAFRILFSGLPRDGEVASMTSPPDRAISKSDLPELIALIRGMADGD